MSQLLKNDMFEMTEIPSSLSDPCTLYTEASVTVWTVTEINESRNKF